MLHEDDVLKVLTIVTEHGLCELNDLASIARVCKTLRDVVAQSNLAWQNTADNDNGRDLTKTQASQIFVLQPRAFEGVRYRCKRSSYNRPMHLYARGDAVKMGIKFHGSASSMYKARVKRRIRMQKLGRTRAMKAKKEQYEMNKRETVFRNELARRGIEYVPTMASARYIRYGNGTLDTTITLAVEEDYLHKIPNFKQRLSQNLADHRKSWGGYVPSYIWCDVLQQVQFETRREILHENRHDSNLPQCLRDKYIL